MPRGYDPRVLNFLRNLLAGIIAIAVIGVLLVPLRFFRLCPRGNTEA